MQNYKIYHKQLSKWYDPEDIFVSLFGKEHYSFWLNGTERFSYMGDVSGSLAKRITYKIIGQELEITEKNKIKKLQQSIFAYFENELLHTLYNELPFDFTGGFVGYFGYELYGNVIPDNEENIPDAYFFFVDRFFAFDQKEKKVYLVCISESEVKAEEWFGDVESRIKMETHPFVPSAGGDRKTNSPPLKGGGCGLEFTLSRNHNQYLQDIKKCQEYLIKGESYQI